MRRQWSGIQPRPRTRRIQVRLQDHSSSEPKSAAPEAPRPLPDETTSYWQRAGRLWMPGTRSWRPSRWAPSSFKRGSQVSFPPTSSSRSRETVESSLPGAGLGTSICGRSLSEACGYRRRRRRYQANRPCMRKHVFRSRCSTSLAHGACGEAAEERCNIRYLRALTSPRVNLPQLQKLQASSSALADRNLSSSTIGGGRNVHFPPR